MITLEKILGALTGKENLYRCGRNFTAIEQALNNVGDGTAADTSYDNTESGMLATDVQAAVDELRAQNNNLDIQIGTMETQTIVANYKAVNNIPTTAKRGKLNTKLKGMSAVNMIKDGNFDATTYWSATGTLSIANNIATYLASSQYANIRSLNQSEIAGHKYYATAMIKSDSASACLYNGYSSTEKITSHSGSNLYERLSALFTSTQTKTSANLFAIQDRRASGWTNIYIQNAQMIDLTALFGAGNEPDLATCDKLFGIYFDGLQGSTGIKTVSCGKNLFDKYTQPSSVNFTDVIPYQNGVKVKATYQGAWGYIRVPIKLKPNTSYFIKYDMTIVTAAGTTPGGINLGSTLSGSLSGSTPNTGSIITTDSSSDFYLDIFSTGGGTISTYGEIIYDNLQIKEGTVDTTYEPYKGTDVEYKTLDGKAITLHRLPNGVYDEITEDGKYIKRIADKTLIVSDIAGIFNSTNVQYATSVIFSDQAVVPGGATIKGNYMLDNRIEVSNAESDNINSIGKFCNGTDGRIIFLVALGTWTNLAAAQTALAGTKIIYQLATPQTLDINAVPLVAEPGGQVSVVPASSPQPSVELSYPTNVGTVIDGLLEAQKQHSELFIDQNAINLDFDLRITALEP